MKYLTDVVTLEFFQEKCTGCGKCVEVCPHGVFFDSRQKRLLLLTGTGAWSAGHALITVNSEL